MPSGLQVWDGANLIVDTTTRMGSFLGLFSTGGANTGSTVIPALAGRDAIYMPVFVSRSGTVIEGGVSDVGLNITYNKVQGRISWDRHYSLYGGGGSETVVYNIVYGVI